MAHWITFKSFANIYKQSEQIKLDSINTDVASSMTISLSTLYFTFSIADDSQIDLHINPKITLTSLNKVLAQSKSYDTIDLTGDEPVIIKEEKKKKVKPLWWHICGTDPYMLFSRFKYGDGNIYWIKAINNYSYFIYLDEVNISGKYDSINQAMQACQEHYERSLGNE